MKKLLILFLFISVFAKAQTDTVYIMIPQKIDTLQIISDYLKSTNYIFPQKKILQNGLPSFVKQQGIFIGGGAGINPAVMAIYNGVTKVKTYDYYLIYISGNYMYNRNLFGLNIGNGIVSFQYLRHIN